MHINEQMTMDGYLMTVVTHIEILVLIVECINKVFVTDFYQLRSILGAKSA